MSASNVDSAADIRDAAAPTVSRRSPLGAALSRIVEQLLSTCGDGAILHVGCGDGELVRALLREGVEARGVDFDETLIKKANLRAPGRFQVGSNTKLPVDDAVADTVVAIHALEHLSDGEIDQALAELRRVARRYLFVVVGIECVKPDVDRASRDIAWWQTRFLAGGFRRHALAFELLPYAALDAPDDDVTLLFETADQNVSMDEDWLRRADRAAEATLARYALAPRFIRPFDAVVDLSAGAGAGLHVVRCGSRAAEISGIVDSQTLADYANAAYGDGQARFVVGDAPTAADVVLSLNAAADLNHVVDVAKRLLRPAGRLLVYVRDDSPTRVQAAFGDALLLEHIFAQSGADEDAPRFLREVSLDTKDLACDGYVLVAMRNPVGAAKDPYRERAYDEYADVDGCHITAFRRDYDNPWLVRALVAIGMRSESPTVLEQLARDALAQSRSGSADQGAALCVLAYRLLESSATADAIRAFLPNLEAFDRAADSTPHAQRWRISNRFVLGRLWMALGDFDAARKALLDCAALDCVVFSPLLATKTIEALLLAGRLALAAGQRDDARDCWRRGVLEARRVLQGDWGAVWGKAERPAWFALPEVTQVVDLATRCGHALEMVDQRSSRPGLSWRLARESWTQRLSQEQSTRAWFERQSGEWRRGVEQRERMIHELRGYLAEIRSACEWYEEQSRRWRQLAEERDAKIHELHGWIEQLEQAKKWLEEQRQHWQSEAEKLTEAAKKRRWF